MTGPLRSCPRHSPTIATRAKSNMEKRIEDIEASIKKLTSVVERLTETVKTTVDKLEKKRKQTARSQFLAHDRIERERYDVLQSLQTRIRGIEQELYRTPDRAQIRQTRISRPIPVISGNQIGKHAWGDMGTSDSQEPPSPKRRRTRAREPDRPPTPGIGGKQIHLKNRDQFKSQYKFNLGTIVLRQWTPKPGEFGQPGWHKVKILGRRLRTDKSPKYKVKWHGFPAWDAVPASWVVEENLKESV